MLAVGNDELGQEVYIGDIIFNSQTGEEITISKKNYGTDGETGKISKMLLFYTKEDCSYLIGVAGKLLNPWEKI